MDPPRSCVELLFVDGDVDCIGVDVGVTVFANATHAWFTLISHQRNDSYSPAPPDPPPPPIVP